MPNKQTFLLEVKGESMINAGILDGDMVLVQEEQTAENGDMVVALIEDGATVKRSIGKKALSDFSQRMILWIRSL